MRILGIETSHDDTSVALWEDNKIVKMITLSQIDIFKEFGGTIPELASREHTKNIQIIFNLLNKNKMLDSLDYIAYTNEPGLIGSLQVGRLFAEGLNIALDVPLVPINHMLGHFYSVNIDERKIKYPALALVVSGGHSEIILAKKPLDYIIVGETQDDAIGEAFDKVSTKCNLGFPGGPIINKIYNKNKCQKLIKFTKPKTLNDLDFSFSGIKTQVVNYYNKNAKNDIDVENIVTSFMDTAINYVIEKMELAINKFNPKSIILCGGVSSNTLLREKFLKLHKNALIPAPEYCQDNGAMIAQCCYEKLLISK
ncbi:O-sialoglycoprotein endopeptidase [Mycoplasmopsis californica]|uniref:N(6)-L-threonylcarbamoyladenine synthase n=1 Tax=Mycoplasmopsis equigenitalium TaxID=114883 RepID=A0ABY5J2H2_9BACT|nr:tRNA (adenosine(37)-N6)-threonylcarbamoyltransferase complex transferase subunit TsaD [Mycoplasmopsis equigenitalium]UUD36924.1 tRNA (adenosine(37)-N6)-threonylcarbamoyltransferase complex transferase subunit TsaD [Mycoplasmopsis equigenitalium]VEU69781.1 O-sialoglycoprotein endopeptidase [Mycoplasmopsis californica]